jgi:hypothetical protein
VLYGDGHERVKHLARKARKTAKKIFFAENEENIQMLNNENCLLVCLLYVFKIICTRFWTV